MDSGFTVKAERVFATFEFFGDLLKGKFNPEKLTKDFAKKRYMYNTGEIEARDVAERARTRKPNIPNLINPLIEQEMLKYYENGRATHMRKTLIAIWNKITILVAKMIFENLDLED